MAQFIDLILILALALNFVALAVSRVRTLIQAVALQGAILGLLPIVMHGPGIHETALSIGTVLIKGIVIPNLLFHALREVNIQREIKPLVNFISSLVLGGVGTGLAIMFSGALPMASEHAGLLLVPASLATVFTGFLILTTRQKAIVLVLGYLILENGIFMFGLLLLEAMPVLVEAGVLLDLFTAVFVMGIIIHHINRTFDSLSTEHLTELKE
jgi:hydrogenase-4 component E